ncbi:MAG: hypothetical protein M1831_003795 [Alyxoria varia]|nr:MAG: hypothetical protein M1831_003795 [Alyxoria varia]
MAEAYLASKGFSLDHALSQLSAEDEVIKVQKIVGARLPKRADDTLWDIGISGDTIASIEPHDASSSGKIKDLKGVINANGRLTCPSLCHAHIHLDKCFLLHDPKYDDLQIERGDFAEAMTLTNQAKQRFDEEDLLRRGSRLIRHSIDSGVTAMRTFVEVDEIVELKCVDAAVKLKDKYRSVCQVQICAFAQLPLFSDEESSKRRDLMQQALALRDVEVVGSAPYVENNDSNVRRNMEWIVDESIKGKYLDFHLDYHLDTETPTIYSLLDILTKAGWQDNALRPDVPISLGHCTRLSVFEEDDWRTLTQALGNLRITFVGLPTSDLFIQGRTLQVLHMRNKFSLACALGVNNVGNAFTPQGTCDPLSVACLGVGVYQSGTKQDAETLYECVSSYAKSAIGSQSSSLDLREGDPADLVLFGSEDGLDAAPRSAAQLVYYPPLPSSERKLVYKGNVSCRTMI